jgi:ribosomal protein S18 acetylase RimI-like enzyme
MNHTKFLGYGCPLETTRSAHEDTPHIEILTLGVLPAYQQRGLARHLIHRVYHYFLDSSSPSRHLDAGMLIYANVATSNVSALSFYERMGMRISSDVIRNMYRAFSYGCRDGYLVVGSLGSVE